MSKVKKDPYEEEILNFLLSDEQTCEILKDKNAYNEFMKDKSGLRVNKVKKYDDLVKLLVKELKNADNGNWHSILNVLAILDVVVEQNDKAPIVTFFTDKQIKGSESSRKYAGLVSTPSKTTKKTVPSVKPESKQSEAMVGSEGKTPQGRD